MKVSKDLHDFSNTRVLIIGDVMIDQYWFGDVKRISPEAPVPVVDLKNVENRLGGAANVALNIHSMGAEVTVLGVVGHDTYGEEVVTLFKNHGLDASLIWSSDQRRTTVKSRIMAQGQNLLRIDQEDKHELSKKEHDTFENLFTAYCSKHLPDIIILQDYNKGLLTKKNIEFCISFANKNGIPTMVDPKKDNFFAYKNCTVFKPNKKEVWEALHAKTDTNLSDIHKSLTEKLHNDYNFITLGSGGIFVGSAEEQNIYPTRQIAVVDVCGAGDTVLSIISLYWTKKLPASLIAQFANLAGGQVCGVAGVAPVDKKMFIQEADLLLNQQVS
jgi:rfaE bifunctional protein kinase chain/domain